MAIRQAFCEYVRFILVSLSESQTTVLKCPQAAIGVERKEPSCVVWSSLRSTYREPCLSP